MAWQLTRGLATGHCPSLPITLRGGLWMYCVHRHQQPLSAMRLEKEAERPHLDLSALWLYGPPRYRGEHEYASARLWCADWLSDFAHVSTVRPLAGQAAE